MVLVFLFSILFPGKMGGLFSKLKKRNKLLKPVSLNASMDCYFNDKTTNYLFGLIQ